MLIRDIIRYIVARAYDKNGLSIERHLKKMNLAFEWLYSVESFTMVRSFILEDVCVGILPMDLAAKHLRQRTIQNFSQNNIHFGEHRICATVLENNKDSLKIKLLIKLLKSIK